MASGRIPDSHLQSPIRSTLRSFLFKAPPKVPPNILNLISTCPVRKKLIHIDSEKSYGIFLSQIYNPSLIISNWASTIYNSALDAASTVARPIMDYLGVTPDEYKLHHLKANHLRWATLKIRWEEIRTIMQGKTRNDGWTKLKVVPDGSDEAHICSTYMVFIPDHDKWYLLDYEQVMLMSDTISSRFFTLLYMDLLLEHTPGKVESSVICELYKPFDQLLSSHGNIAYESISYWESIVFACILYQHDPLDSAKKYYNWRLESLEEAGRNVAVELVNIITEYNFKVEQMCELHGLYRHWGHPTDDEELGCAGVRNIAKNRPTPDYKTQKDMLGLFKRQFIISFISKHGRWPRCNLPDGEDYYS